MMILCLLYILIHTQGSKMLLEATGSIVDVCMKDIEILI